MSAAHVPPRPDGMHPMPGRPRSPGPPAGEDGADPAPRATWNAWEGIAVYVVAILLGGAATIPFLRLIDDEDLANVSSTAAAAVVITGVLVAWLSNSHPTWRRVLGLPPRGGWWAEIRSSVGFGLILYPSMVFGVGLLVALLLEAASGEQTAVPEQVSSDLSAVGVVVTIVYAIVIAPIHEELFFRGVLFRGVRDRHGLGAGLLASGLGFALIHYLDAPWEDALLLMGVMFFNGIALSWWFERRGTIVAPVVTHMVFNVIGLSMIFLLD
ncbi:MAG: CPBP family intramembrane glutamic endopeptidase [Actinomycetota bacterium]